MLRPEDCKPGTLVECISAEPTNLTLGAVYTIKDTAMGFGILAKEWCFGVELEEISPPRCVADGYLSSRFRLLPDSRLAVFRAMLAPIPMKELVHDRF